MSSTVTRATDILMALICMTGLIFNGIVLYITSYRMKAKGLDVKLSILTSILDIVFSMTFLILLLIKWGVDYEVVTDGSWWCKTSATLLVDTALCSVNVVAILALVRYLTIVKGQQLRDKTWIILTTLLVLISTLMALASVANGYFRVMPSGSYCEPGKAQRLNASSSIAIYQWVFSLFSLTLLLTSLGCLLFCYIKITNIYRHQLQRAADEMSSHYQIAAKQSHISTASFPWADCLAKKKKVTITMVLILLAYATNLSPMMFSIFLTVGTRSPPSPIFDSIAACLTAALVITNPTFVLFVHEATHYELMVILGLRHRRRSLHPYAGEFTNSLDYLN